MKLLILSLISLTVIWSCSQSIPKNINPITIEKYGKFNVPKYISKYHIDTLNFGEVKIEFRNNFDQDYNSLENYHSFKIIINSLVERENTLTVEQYHQLLVDRFKSENGNREMSFEQIKNENNLGVSIFKVSYLNRFGEKRDVFKYFKHYINYSDSIEIRMSFDGVCNNCEESVLNELIKDAEFTINRIDYKHLSKSR